MKKISVIFLLAIVVTFGLCIAIENTSTTKTMTDSHNLFTISKTHTVICDISGILQKIFQKNFTPTILIIAGMIFLLSPPLLTAILINRRRYYRKLNWSTPPLSKIFLKLNPKLYA